MCFDINLFVLIAEFDPSLETRLLFLNSSVTNLMTGVFPHLKLSVYIYKLEDINTRINYDDVSVVNFTGMLPVSLFNAMTINITRSTIHNPILYCTAELQITNSTLYCKVLKSEYIRLDNNINDAVVVLCQDLYINNNSNMIIADSTYITIGGINAVLVAPLARHITTGILNHTIISNPRSLTIDGRTRKIVGKYKCNTLIIKNEAFDEIRLTVSRDNFIRLKKVIIEPNCLLNIKLPCLVQTAD